MNFLSFMIDVFIISLSGVMAPGPMTAVTIGRSGKTAAAGPLVAVGHGIVELPIIILLFFGLGNIIDNPDYKIFFLLSGAVFLLYLSAGMFKSSLKKEVKENDGKNRSLVGSGAALSLFNPYFFIWWITIGSALIIKSRAFGVKGFALFSLVHLSCDFLWLTILSFAANRSVKFFGEMFNRVISFLCGVLLLFVSVKFFIDIFNFAKENNLLKGIS